MSKGFRVASWVVGITTVVLCDALFVSMVALLFLEDASFDAPTSSVTVGAAVSDFLLEQVVSVLWMVLPVLLLASVILGIVAAASKYPDALVTTRAIMLLYKLGLIPFFIAGGFDEVILIIAGFHPVLVGFGWILAIICGVMGWCVMFSGSMWAIATAIHLKRQRRISGGELAAHIILQLIFVADVIDGIILFVRSKRLPSADPQSFA